MTAFAMIGGIGAKYLLLLRSCHVNKAPINVAILPKIMSGKIAPPNMLLIRHPKNTPGIPAGVSAGRIVSASENGSALLRMQRCTEHSQYDIDCGDHCRLCHEKHFVLLSCFHFLILL